MICRFCEHPISPTRNRCPACGRAFDAPRGDYTAYFSREDTEKHRGVAALSYLAFLVIVPLLFSRRSHFARFHANQGLTLMIITTAYTLITRIFVNFLDILFGGVYAAIPSTLSSIFNFGSIFFVILLLLGMVNAARGRAKELPLIGRIRFLV